MRKLVRWLLISLAGVFALVVTALLVVSMLDVFTPPLATVRIPATDVADQQAALQLGQRVEAVRAAIQHPEAPGSLAAVIELGHDQRYYVMVRGWLAWQLRGDISILDASGDQPREHINARVNFIKEAIRAIDLE